MITRVKGWSASLSFQVLVIAIASRLMLMVTNWFALNIFRVFDRGYPKLFDELIPATHPLAGWSRWDAAHYALIAFDGYVGPSGEAVQTRGFFPLYPMVIRALSWLQPGTASRADVAIWGVVAANICFLAMVVVLAKVIAIHHGADVALTATMLLMVSPMSFFFNAGYSESLFLLCSVVAFWFAYRQQWLSASVVIALASATRLLGLVLIPCILIVAWQKKSQIRDMVSIAGIGVLGALSYALWTWIKYDDALAYWHAQSTFWGDWHDRVGGYIDLMKATPREMINSPENFVILINLVLALIALIALPWVWKHVEPGMALFTTIIVVFHTGYTWHSLGRYLLAAVGVYIVLGMLLSKSGWSTGVRTAVIVASSILLATMNIMFAHGFWIV